MGTAEPPYIYDQPQQNRSSIIAYPYSHFNPKAVTEASYAAISQQSLHKPKQNGPLINFNQHPDSYMIVTGQQVDHKPLPANTKKAVTILRWILFAIRIIQEIGALGLLGITICIRGTTGSDTYLLRIPQALDSLITLYAIVHLIRPAKARTPASSCSYHFFALFMDVGLIPFYVFVAMVTNNQYTTSVGVDGQAATNTWSSFFEAAITSQLLLTVWIAAIAMGGLHLMSACFDVALIIIFRKIAHLPPDMNPLEENLTGRRTMFNPRHKHKNSEYTLSTDGSMTDAEKKMSSTSTFSVVNQSQTSFTEKDTSNNDRRVPFRHSRTGSTTDLAYSAHNPESARWSRHQYDGQQNLYREAVSTDKSRYAIGSDGKLEVRTRRARPRSHSPTKRSSAATPTIPNIPDLPDMTNQGPQFNLHPATPDRFSLTPTRATAQDQQKESLLKDNWYTLGEDDEAADLGSPMRRSRNGYQPVHDRHDSAYEPMGDDMFGAHAEIKPLGMNPPTPPPPQPEEQYPDPDEKANTTAGVSRTLTAASHNTTASSIYSESAPSLLTTMKGPGTPKGKYYGDLAAATRGVRGNSPKPNYNMPASARNPVPTQMSEPLRAERVVSRSGADIVDEAGPYGAASQAQRGGYGLRSRRDVSGKIVEEGRGGVDRNDWAEGKHYR